VASVGCYHSSTVATETLQVGPRGDLALILLDMPSSKKGKASWKAPKKLVNRHIVRCYQTLDEKRMFSLSKHESESTAVINADTEMVLGQQEVPGSGSVLHPPSLHVPAVRMRSSESRTILSAQAQTSAQ
jgi:hypothetical protein